MVTPRLLNKHAWRYMAAKKDAMRQGLVLTPNMIRLQLTRKLKVISTVRHFKYLFNLKPYFCPKRLGVDEKSCLHVWIQKSVFEIMEWIIVWWLRTLALACIKTKLVCGKGSLAMWYAVFHYQKYPCLILSPHLWWLLHFQLCNSFLWVKHYICQKVPPEVQILKGSNKWNC